MEIYVVENPEETLSRSLSKLTQNSTQFAPNCSGI